MSQEPKEQQLLTTLHKINKAAGNETQTRVHEQETDESEDEEEDVEEHLYVEKDNESELSSDDGNDEGNEFCCVSYMLVCGILCFI
ncbi:unnamed protein product [Brassica rapa]|uniref:Uncharacterized protein n=1 Tax=Brassica campestris TaxID=3711 RepID=A0A8D9H438_BRACM|nr:unnamed protein product [Brassica rapa]